MDITVMNKRGQLTASKQLNLTQQVHGEVTYLTVELRAACRNGFL